MTFEIIPNWHPIFVHFTVALFSTATGLFIIGSIAKKTGWAKTVINAAYINLWIGALVTIATIIAGLYAYSTVNHDAPSHMAMTDHRNWAFGTTILFILITLWSFKIYNRGKVGMSFLTVLVFATILLSITAWKGGELVYRYGLGVIAMPSNSGGHDDHKYGDHKGRSNGVQIDTERQSEEAEHHDHSNHSMHSNDAHTEAEPKPAGHENHDHAH